MFLFIFLLYIITFSKINCSIDCSSNSANCIDCDESKKRCSRCKNGYVLKGISQFSTNNEIKCVQASTTSSGYFKTDEGVYYPCSNNDYSYLRNDESKCYRYPVLSINNFYSTDNKHFYPCDESNGSVNGINNCLNCNLNSAKNALICQHCQYSYAFLNKDYTHCHEIQGLIDDKTIYKQDEDNFMSCSINNCLYCSSKFVCTQCNVGYFFKNSLRTKCFDLSEITQDTPIDEYYLLDDKYYYLCALNGGVEHCKKCSDRYHCTMCETGYTILDNDNTKCKLIKAKVVKF